MTPTPTILEISGQIDAALYRVKVGQRLDHYDRGRLHDRVVLLIWQLTHDPQYIASGREPQPAAHFLEFEQ